MSEAIKQMDGLGWLLLMLGLLLLFQRWVHLELQAVFLIATRRLSASLAIFSIILLPGVFLHELSHFLMAKILLVQTGRFSLVPKLLPNGRLQMGYVETAAAGIARDALIGAAPLVSGLIFLGYVGLIQMNLIPVGNMLIQGNTAQFWAELGRLPGQKDFWVWFYFSFVVSSTMFPSASDRRAWLPMILVVAALVLAALVVGAGPWLAETAAPALNQVFHTFALILGISLTIHALVLAPIWGLRLLLSRLTGLRVV